MDHFLFKNPSARLSQEIIWVSLKLLCCCNFIQNQKHSKCWFSQNLKNLILAQKISIFSQKIMLVKFKSLCCCSFKQKIKSFMHWPFIIPDNFHFGLISCPFWHKNSKQSFLYMICISFKSLNWCNFMQRIKNVPCTDFW